MLDKHLIAKTYPIAKRENIVFWQDYRVTVLGARLFRLEQSAQGKFRDEATQAVWFRDAKKTDFTFVDKGETAEIDTGAAKLILHKDRGQVCVALDGKRVFADNEDNLLGTYRTLDCCNADVYYSPWLPDIPPKKIALGTGVCSKSGVAVLDDSESLTLQQNGEIKNEIASGSDEYIFAFGNDYRGAVQALYQITGATPIVPRYALGNWWSRYHVYTDEEYLRVLNRFEERDIPLTVATVDMDWHYSDYVKEELEFSKSGKDGVEYVGNSWSVGWTGYTWNENLFPDYKKFLKELQRKNLKITLNLHPSDGVRWWERDYEKMAEVLGLEKLDGKQISFDFSSAEFINAYFSVLHRPYERDGVDFWWMDWQQKNIPWTDGEKDGATADYDPLWALNHYHYLDNADGHSAPLLLSRYAGVGSHRYPLGFSGDTEITWNTLGYLPYFTATATNVGYTWWSHDIGGHNFGEKNDELYVRHIQYGVFSPVNRLHCACYDTMTKEPWEYGDGAGLIAAEFLRFRHRLIPYLYTASKLTNTQGLALVEPLYYRHADKAVYEYKQTYYFGSELLVAPVTERAKKDGYARVKTWLPAGRWTDIFTGDVYEGGKKGRKLILHRKLDSIPVLAKAGGVLPLSMDKGNACDNPEKLEIRIYNGDGKYTLLEDGAQRAIQGEYRTEFTNTLVKRAGACTQITEIFGDGDSGVIPKNRVLRLRFDNIQQGEIRVFADGKRCKASVLIADCAMVEIPAKAGVRYRVEAAFATKSEVKRLQERALRVLTQSEGKNTEKYNAWKELERAGSVQEYLTAVEKADLPAITKTLLKETL